MIQYCIVLVWYGIVSYHIYSMVQYKLQKTDLEDRRKFEEKREEKKREEKREKRNLKRKEKREKRKEK